MFLRLGLFMPRMSPFLCLRRGVSRLVDGAPVSGCFSLPTQRCFHQCRKEVAGIDLFSAYAEVFPGYRPICGTSFTFLCLRRGVSVDEFNAGIAAAFSLPTQRCFQRPSRSVKRLCLFSAYAEVFLSEKLRTIRLYAFLCLRRGVSYLHG